jgi:hypothetical protein
MVTIQRVRQSEVNEMCLALDGMGLSDSEFSNSWISAIDQPVTEYALTSCHPGYSVCIGTELKGTRFVTCRKTATSTLESRAVPLRCPPAFSLRNAQSEIPKLGSWRNHPRTPARTKFDHDILALWTRTSEVYVSSIYLRTCRELEYFQKS